MSIDLDALFAKKAFASLDAERMALFRKFAQDINGKGTPEIMALFMQFNQALSKKKPITAEERAAMSAAILEALPEADKSKFNNVLRMLKV